MLPESAGLFTVAVGDAFPAVVVAPACARAIRAVARRTEQIMEKRGVDRGQYWMESATFPCPGVGREDFLEEARELLSRSR